MTGSGPGITGLCPFRKSGSADDLDIIFFRNSNYNYAVNPLNM